MGIKINLKAGNIIHFLILLSSVIVLTNIISTLSEFSTLTSLSFAGMIILQINKFIAPPTDTSTTKEIDNTKSK